MDSDFISIYFKKEKPINMNDLNENKFKSIKGLNKFKTSLKSFEEYNSEIDLLKMIESDLKIKIQKIEDKINIQSTYLEAIKIKNYFSIKDMQIDDLNAKKEIYFVGENGDGKTILLQAMALALKYNNYSDLANLYLGETKKSMELSTKDIYNKGSDYKKFKNVSNVFAYGINRNKINDEESKASLGYSALFDTPSMTKTTYLREPQNILLNKSDTIKESIIEEFIIEIVKLMGDKLEILIVGDKLKFKEKDGEYIEFNMLSEGYKSTIIWLSDLVSRLMDNQENITKLSDYEAIVLIDEVDLYLHPKWKYDFVYKLRQMFPKIQFIMTTHSIVTVLGASNDDETVFYKIYKEKGETKVSEQIDSISHYTANILITSPLFNLENVKTRNYDKNERVSSDDYVYNKIHKKIKEKINTTNSVNSKEIDDWLDEEFKKEFNE
jgi:predicted ATP-binding protein involved in virulence